MVTKIIYDTQLAGFFLRKFAWFYYGCWLSMLFILLVILFKWWRNVPSLFVSGCFKLYHHLPVLFDIFIRLIFYKVRPTLGKRKHYKVVDFCSISVCHKKWLVASPDWHCKLSTKDLFILH